MAGMVVLGDSRTVPSLAFGTSRILDDQMPEALRAALDTGYRHIDTACLYQNEQFIGPILSEYFAQGKLKREEIFVTTKLAPTFMAKDDVRGAVEDSLKKLQLTYVDLMLIHHPWGLKNHGDGTLMPTDEHGNYELETYDLVETWKELEKFVSEGKIRSLGVSNFNSEQLERICAVAKVPPVVNQVECHPYLPQKELRAWCQKRNIILEAYAVLGSRARPAFLKREKEPQVVEEPVLKSIGDKYGKTPAQVIIRCLLQRGIVVVVKSATSSRIKENFQVFDFNLSAEDMAAIDKLRTDFRYFTYKIPAGSHPEYPFRIPF